MKITDDMSNARGLVGHRYRHDADLKGHVYLEMWRQSQSADERAKCAAADVASWNEDGFIDVNRVALARQIVTSLTDDERAACGLMKREDITDE